MGALFHLDDSKRLISDVHYVISVAMSEAADFPVIHATAEELRSDPGYCFDNANREAVFVLAIQRTLAGKAFFRDAAGVHDVPVDHAMLFTHSEPSSYGYPPGATESYRHRFISFSGAGLKDLFQLIRQDFGSVVSMHTNSEATLLFNEISSHYETRTFRDRLHQSELLYRLLLSLYREQMQDTRTTDPIEFGYHYVKNHFRSPVNLKEVAEKCGISREHFIREFSARYPESPGCMLRRLRLDHARAMLDATRLSVQDIALASGFTSSNSFCRAFRLKHGVSPGAGRK